MTGTLDAADATPADDAEQPADTTVESRWERLAPLVLVAVPVVFNLIHLRAELRNAAPVNDYGVHRAWIEWAADRIRAGHVPIDGWVPNLANGVPQFRYYQTTPHVLTALTEIITGLDHSIRWFAYLLMAAFPISIYGATRRLGLGRWTAAGAALMSVFLASADGHGFETQSYIWRGRGLYSQLWAQLLLPWAIVLGWRAVKEGRRYGRAVAVLALTCCLHLLQAYLVLLFLPLMFLLAPSDLRRIPRIIGIGIGTVCAAAWVLVPVFVGGTWISESEFNEGTFFLESYGARKILGWLVSGEVADAGRFPWITLLASVGAVICVLRWRSEAHRLVALFTVYGLCLWFGRPTWGALLDLLPGGGNLIYHRFVFAVQLGLLWLAGIAAGEAVALARRLLTRAPGPLVRIPERARVPLATGAVAVVLVAGLVPSARVMREYLSFNDTWIAAQETADESPDGRALATALATARAESSGRVYSGMLSGWGVREAIGQAPLLNWNTSHFSNTLGFNLRTLSLTGDVEPYFNDQVPAQFNLFNVRYWLTRPASQQPQIPAEVIGDFGPFRLWRMPSTGWLDVIDIDGTPLRTANNRIGSTNQNEFLLGAGPEQKRFRQMILDWQTDVTEVPSTYVAGVPAGRVLDQRDRAADGDFSGTVEMQRDAYVLLKESYHPGWRATVDGTETDTVMVTPGFVAVKVPAGRHAIAFQYEPLQWYWLLWLIGLVAVMLASDRFRLPLCRRAQPLWQQVRGRLPAIRRATGPRRPAPQ